MFNFEVCTYLSRVKSKIPDFERGKATILATIVRFTGPTRPRAGSALRYDRQEYIRYFENF